MTNRMMRGIVTIFNAVKGVGFLGDEDGTRRFFHFSELLMEGFRGIAVGTNVEFMPMGNNGRPTAQEVNAIDGSGLRVANPHPKAMMVDKGIVPLRVDTLDRIYAQEDLFPFGEFLVPPSVWVDDAFRAFRTSGMVKTFAIHLPQPTSERVFLLLDPDKKPLTPSSARVHTAPGSYVLSLEENGALDIQSIGRRFQKEKGGGNWAVLEHRFRHTLILDEGIANQLPTSGLERDNDGFIPAIEEAITLLSQQREGVVS